MCMSVSDTKKEIRGDAPFVGSSIAFRQPKDLDDIILNILAPLWPRSCLDLVTFRSCAHSAFTFARVAPREVNSCARRTWKRRMSSSKARALITTAYRKGSGVGGDTSRTVRR